VAPESSFRRRVNMRLVISLCFPDGSSPTKERLRFYREEDASETIAVGWREGLEIKLQMPSGIMTCKILALVKEEAECFGGAYTHAIMQEKSFASDSNAQKRLQ
jgi:hypothetical protein